jgi:predicted nucleotidyltransferase
MSKAVESIFKNQEKEIEKIALENAIKYIGVFGSYSRDEQKDSSDLDLFIKFDFKKSKSVCFHFMISNTNWNIS